MYNFFNNSGRLDLNDLVGFIAAFCTTVSFVPQAIKVYKTKSTTDISLGMFLLMSVGVAFWDAYGFLIGAMPVILANSATLILSVYILIMKLMLDRKESVNN